MIDSVLESLACRSVRSQLWDFAGHTLSEFEAAEVAGHLETCRECRMFQLEVGSVRSGLKHLPVRSPSALLSTRLKVIASRERSRKLIRRDPKAWMREIFSRIKLSFDNLLRPIAIPATGGIAASVICFGMIVSTMNLRPSQYLLYDNDMPLGLFAEVGINELTPFSYSGPDVMVTLTVDAKGTVTDYDLPHNVNATPEMMRGIGNLVLYSTFTPARNFGQPVSSKRLFYIGHMSVRD